MPVCLTRHSEKFGKAKYFRCQQPSDEAPIIMEQGSPPFQCERYALGNPEDSIGGIPSIIVDEESEGMLIRLGRVEIDNHRHPLAASMDDCDYFVMFHVLSIGSLKSAQL